MRIYRCTVVAYGPTVVDCIVKSRIRDLCVSYIDRGKSMRYVGAGASAGGGWGYDGRTNAITKCNAIALAIRGVA